MQVPFACRRGFWIRWRKLGLQAACALWTEGLNASAPPPPSRACNRTLGLKSTWAAALGQWQAGGDILGSTAKPFDPCSHMHAPVDMLKCNLRSVMPDNRVIASTVVCFGAFQCTLDSGAAARPQSHGMPYPRMCSMHLRTAT